MSYAHTLFLLPLKKNQAVKKIFDIKYIFAIFVMWGEVGYSGRTSHLKNKSIFYVSGTRNMYTGRQVKTRFTIKVS